METLEFPSEALQSLWAALWSSGPRSARGFATRVTRTRRWTPKSQGSQRVRAGISSRRDERHDTGALGPLRRGATPLSFEARGSHAFLCDPWVAFSCPCDLALESTGLKFWGTKGGRKYFWTHIAKFNASRSVVSGAEKVCCAKPCGEVILSLCFIVRSCVLSRANRPCKAINKQRQHATQHNARHNTLGSGTQCRLVSCKSVLFRSIS